MRAIRLLGTPEIESAEGTVRRFRSQRTVALLGYLVAERRTITRERLAALFWPEDGLRQAKGKLRRELYNLSQLLPGCWEVDRVQVRFSPSAATSVDLDSVRQHEAAGEWQAAADLLRGEFLEGVGVEQNLAFETWLLAEQERWRHRSTAILAKVLDDFTQKGQLQEALPYGYRLLQIAPWDEAAYIRIMRLLAQAGQPLAALRQFKSYRRYVVEELNVSPSARMLDLVQQIENAMKAPAHNLPAQVTPFVNRKVELASVGERLEDRGVRLVTLMGPGGIGKTRLALEAAWRHYRAAGLSTYFVPLQGVRSANGLVRAIGAAVGFQFSGLLDPWEQLLRYLRNQKMLLLVDNFEHLAAHASLLGEILAAAPGISLLVTSRERLRLYGETVFPVKGLDGAGGEDTGESSSLKLFVQTARRVQPAYRPERDEVAFIRQISRLVEGMPLALELTASWISVLSPAQILGEMEKSPDALSSAAREHPDRHVSMEAVFNHSWNLLTPPEQETLENLSVFVGDFDLDAALNVAGASPPLLQSLVDRSLLHVDRSNRYRVHELLRQYSARRLSAHGERQQQTVKRHCTYYADLLYGYELESKRNLSAVAGTILKTQAEIRNIQTAWQYASDRCLVKELSHFSYCLSLFYEFQGLFREGKAAFDRALGQIDSCRNGVSPRARMRLLSHFGWMCHDLKEEALARQSLEEAYSLTPEVDSAHRADISLTLFFLGWVSHVQGNTERGRSLLKLGEQLSRAADFEFGLVVIAIALAEVEYDNGNYAEALAYLDQVPPSAGPYHMQLKLELLAAINSALSNHAEAVAYLRQMIELQEALPNISGYLLVITGIASLYGHQGNYRRAVEFLVVTSTHPQFGSFMQYRAESLLNEFRSKLPQGTYKRILDENNRGQLDISFLVDSFGVDAQMIAALSRLLDEASP